MNFSRQAIHFIAEKIGKFAWEVAQLTPDEFYDWLAYFKIQQEEEKKAFEKASREAKSKRR